MKIYISGRQFGKTTMLIKESARTGATLDRAIKKLEAELETVPLSSLTMKGEEQ